MSVIIRLQNLPWSANALDIRAFFRGLSIPDGGVHIVGGEMGDAFIAFSTDEDARQAMMLDRKKINEVQIRLLLSSRAEMQKVIEQARQQSLAMMQMASKQPQITQPQSPKSLSAPQPPIITSTSLQNILSQQKSTFSDTASQAHQIINQILSDTSTDSRDSRDKTSTDHVKISDRDTRDRDYFKVKNRDRSGRSTHSGSHSRSRSRSRSRDRRRSRSRDRDRSNARRRGYRSRTRSPDRRTRRRRSRDRSRDRDRADTNKIRDRSRSRSRERERGRNYNHDSNDKKLSVEKESKVDSTKSFNMTDNTNKTDVGVKVDPWSLYKQSPSQSQTPVYTTNYGQGFNLNQMQCQASNMPSVFGNLQQFPTSFPPQLQQLQMSQLQYQQQSQTMLQQNLNQVLQNQQQNDTGNLNIQSLLTSTLNPPVNNPLFNASGTNNFKPGDTAKSFLNPYVLDQNSSSFPALSGNNENSMNQPADFSKFFNNKSANDNNFGNNKEYNRGFRNSSPTREVSKDKHSEYNSNRNNSKYNGQCVKMTNMCPSTTYSDIRKFFSGLYIANNGIKLINDKTGNRVGIAYLRFVREESKSKAFFKNGLILKNKKVVIESVTETEFEEAIDSYKPNKWNKFQDNKTDDNVKEKIKESDKLQQPKESDDYSALLLEDLPPFATEQDVMKIFSIYTVIDIIFTRQTIGKKQFIAYVKFHQKEDAKKALSDKIKHSIGHKQISVSPCSDEVFEKAKRLHTMQDDNDNDDDDDDEEMKESEEDKNENLEDVNDDAKSQESTNKQNEKNNKGNDKNDTQNIKNEEILDDLTKNQNFKTTNEKYKEDNDDSNDNKKAVIDETPKIPSLLSLNPVLPTDPRQRNRGWGGDSINLTKNRLNNNTTRYVFLKNCDYKATKVDLLYFFGKINVTPVHIEFLKNDRGQQNGEAIVEFGNPDDADKSLDNHNALCNNRRIKIELVPPSFVANKLGEDFLKESNFNSRNSFDTTNNGSNNLNSKKDGGSRQKPSRFSDINDSMNNSTTHHNDNKNRFSGGTSEKNNSNQKPFIGGGIGNNNDMKKDMTNDRFFNFGNNRNNRTQQNHQSQGISNSAVDQFGKPGCVVSLENVPYKAGTNDIIEFFQKFNIQPHNVIRRYNDDGTPTGDARVAFSAPIEAQQAIKTKNKHKIFGRTIFLSLV